MAGDNSQCHRRNIKGAFNLKIRSFLSGFIDFFNGFREFLKVFRGFCGN
jgi:hypothetical protein